MKSRIKRIIAGLLAFAITIPTSVLPTSAASQTAGDFYGSFVESNGTPVKDLDLKIENLDGQKIAETSTNENGQFEFKDISTGGYVLKIDSVIYGVGDDDASDYAKDGGYLITIMPNKANTFIKGGSERVLKRVAGTITVEKTLKDIGTPLPNVTFALYKGSDSAPIKTAKTDANGKIVWNGIAFGEYTIRETAVPDGIILGTENKTVSISSSAPEKTVSFKNDRQCSIIVYKKNHDNEALKGASFQLYLDKGNGNLEAIGEPVETDVNGTITFNVAPGKYCLKEVKAPEGYDVNEQLYNAEVTNAENKNTVQLNIFNKKTEIPKYKVTINKFETNTTTAVVGAKLEVWQNNKKLEETITDGRSWDVELENGTYTLKETVVPAGYIKAKDVQFTVQDKDITVNMYDEYTTLIVSKLEKTTENVLANAKLEIRNENNEKIYEFTTKDKPYVIQRIPVGKYKLIEVEAPTGYIVSEPVEFEIKENAKPHTVTMYDDYTKVKISKVDITTKEELPGATLIIKDKTGTEIERWVSTNEPHLIEKLPVGDYVLSEIKAPNGYICSEDIEFTVKATGEIQLVTMHDDYTKVEISKQDLTTKKELPGAKLTVKNENGDIIDTWISTKEPHMINRLMTGKYVLIETTAPDGYLVSEEIEFVVEDTVEVQKVTMYDDYTKLYISKLDITTEKALPGAHLELKDPNGKSVERWISLEEPRYFEKLSPGKYTLIENQAPEGYLISEAIEFEIKATGEIQTVKMYDDYTKIKISKQDLTTKKELPGAKLKLTTESGELIEEWTSTETPHEIYKLEPGVYVLTETLAPEGYKVAESIMFRLKATGKMQKLVMYDELVLYDITISKTDAISGNLIKDAKFKLVNEKDEVIEEWTSTTKKHEIKELKPGKYKIVEISAPSGYIKGEDVEFELKSDGTTKDLDFVIKNDYTKLKICKLIENSNTMLAGAKLRLEDEKGKTIAEWTSTKEAFVINHLEPGIYKLVEISAPDGYEKAETIKFELKETGKVQTIKMYDKAKVVKEDKVTTEEDTSKNVPTGDSFIVTECIIMLVSLVSILFVFKKKNK